MLMVCVLECYILVNVLIVFSCVVFVCLVLLVYGDLCFLLV